ncbi:cadherin-related family member 1-like [Mauremys reevesii]|uniref:cadherin-related family member 1-like n=1 Tax=Mauremys reevesii TaxID=260615 RepID=UPI00193F89D3|nr:cadherin-related family member 1-like [Mauremys reevesii]
MILLQVKARDHLSPYFEAHSTITISLLDENDNTPAFEGTPYKQQIFSNMTVGMPVLQIVAHDPDDGINGETWFILVSGNEEGHFELNETSGQISLKTLIPLLVNQLKNFTLWITATDGTQRGIPFLCISASSLLLRVEPAVRLFTCTCKWNGAKKFVSSSTGLCSWRL